jgi:alpha-glucuronidase
MYLDGRQVGKWEGRSGLCDGQAPTPSIDRQTATRMTFNLVNIKRGSALKIVGSPDGQRPAPVDSVSIVSEGVVNLNGLERCKTGATAILRTALCQSLDV